MLNQFGGSSGLLTFDHQYILESEENGTWVIVHEEYRGVAVNFWNPAPVEVAYQKLVKALQTHVGKTK